MDRLTESVDQTLDLARASLLLGSSLILFLGINLVTAVETYQGTAFERTAIALYVGLILVSFVCLAKALGSYRRMKALRRGLD